MQAGTCVVPTEQALWQIDCSSVSKCAITPLEIDYPEVEAQLITQLELLSSLLTCLPKWLDDYLHTTLLRDPQEACNCVHAKWGVRLQVNSKCVQAALTTGT